LELDLVGVIKEGNFVVKILDSTTILDSRRKNFPD
jgi:hypothetical protein